MPSSFPFSRPFSQSLSRSLVRPGGTIFSEFVAKTGATDMAGTETLINYVTAQEKLANFRLWSGKSAQNAGSGSTWYGIGGLNDVDFTLYNSLPWGANGFDLNGTNHYAATDMGLQAWTEMWAFARIAPDIASAPNTATKNTPWSFGEAQNAGSSDTGSLSCTNSTTALSGETFMLIPHDEGTSDATAWRSTGVANPRYGTSFYTWTAAEDHMLVIRLASSGITVWKNKVSIGFDKLRAVVGGDNITPAGLGATSGMFVIGGVRNGGIDYGTHDGKIIALAICNGSLTTGQWQQINDYMAAL
jgi:hypothetical protein